MFVSLWRYLKEMDKFTKENPGQVLTLRYEDMKAVCYWSKVLDEVCKSDCIFWRHFSADSGVLI